MSIVLSEEFIRAVTDAEHHARLARGAILAVQDLTGIPIARDAPAEADEPDMVKAKFVRDKSIVLGDQAKNPGSMNIGPRSRNFDAYGSYEGTKGNKTALFPSFVHGTAALIDRILSNRGVTVQEYIMGGPTIPVKFSYSGGWGHEGYVAAMRHMGIKPDEVISESSSSAFLFSMVNAHAYAEGNLFRVKHLTTEDRSRVFELLRERSKYYETQAVSWDEVTLA